MLQTCICTRHKHNGKLFVQSASKYSSHCQSTKVCDNNYNGLTFQRRCVEIECELVPTLVVFRTYTKTCFCALWSRSKSLPSPIHFRRKRYDVLLNLQVVVFMCTTWREYIKWLSIICKQWTHGDTLWFVCLHMIWWSCGELQWCDSTLSTELCHYLWII